MKLYSKMKQIKTTRDSKFSSQSCCAICGIRVSYGFKYNRIHFCYKHNINNYLDSKGKITNITAYNKCKSILDLEYNPYNL